MLCNFVVYSVHTNISVLVFYLNRLSGLIQATLIQPFSITANTLLYVTHNNTQQSCMLLLLLH